jgi:hypothetical protein
MEPAFASVTSYPTFAVCGTRALFAFVLTSRTLFVRSGDMDRSLDIRISDLFGFFRGFESIAG